MNTKAFQDEYPDELSHCYGCGKNNAEGHQLKSYWDDGSTIAHFRPEPWHIAIPGYVYGGLIASLIDCHGTGSASAAAARAEGQAIGSGLSPRFVTASLKVDYLAPTPLGEVLELRGEVAEITGRKIIVDVTVSARNEVCAKGRVVAVKMPEHMLPAE